MSIRVKCPGCERILTVKETAAGKRIRCSNDECKTVINIPLQPKRQIPTPVARGMKDGESRDDETDIDFNFDELSELERESETESSLKEDVRRLRRRNKSAGKSSGGQSESYLAVQWRNAKKKLHWPDRSREDIYRVRAKPDGEPMKLDIATIRELLLSSRLNLRSEVSSSAWCNDDGIPLWVTIRDWAPTEFRIHVLYRPIKAWVVRMMWEVPPYLWIFACVASLGLLLVAFCYFATMMYFLSHENPLYKVLGYVLAFAGGFKLLVAILVGQGVYMLCGVCIGVVCGLVSCLQTPRAAEQL